MHYVSEYTFVGDRSKERSRQMMEVFGQRGDVPGAISHWVKADGTGGFILVESDDIEALYEQALHFSEYLEVETMPVLPLEKALPKIDAYLS